MDKLDRLRTVIGQLAPDDTPETFHEGLTPNLAGSLSDPRGADAVDRLAHHQDLGPDGEFALEAIVLPRPFNAGSAASPSPPSSRRPTSRVPHAVPRCGRRPESSWPG